MLELEIWSSCNLEEQLVSECKKKAAIIIMRMCFRFRDKLNTKLSKQKLRRAFC